MKKLYVSPELDVLLLRISDIITASGVSSGSGGDEDDDDHDTPIDPFNFNWT